MHRGTTEAVNERVRRPGLWVLALAPLAMYVIFESATGNLLQIRGIPLILNLIFFYMFYSLGFVLTNSSRVTCIFLNTLLTVLALGEYYVVDFRYRPIMVWDALSLRTAVSVSSSYQYDITPGVASVVCASLALSALAFKFPFRIEKGRLRARAAALAAGGSALFLALFYGKMIDGFDLHTRMWDPVVSYREDGYILSTMVGISYLKADAPEGYSPERAAGIAARAERELDAAEAAAAQAAANTLEAQAVTETPGTQAALDDTPLRWKTDTDITPTHIICIMNESFSDLGEIRDFPTNVPYLDYYRSLEDNCLKGDLYVPVFGAMTCNTEFEFLTGNSLVFAPEGSVPFQLYMKEPSYSLASLLKDQGYETIAMHPYPAGNWNREQAYAAMGFDTFLAEEFFEGSETLRGYVSDRANYEKITEVTESRKGDPLFIFNVTMQNHGGYGHEDFEPTVWPAEYEGAPLAEQYLTLMRESDQALEYLIEYYKDAEDPTMIVLFGDHRPGLENGFYEYLLGKPIAELSIQEYADLYTTPFLVWTNYETPFEESEGLSAPYLSTCVLERANLKLSGYNYLLDRMSREALAVHFLGYKDGEGLWHPWDGEEPPVFAETRIMQYNNMFDLENRIDGFFAVD